MAPTPPDPDLSFLSDGIQIEELGKLATAMDGLEQSLTQAIGRVNVEAQTDAVEKITVVLGKAKDTIRQAGYDWAIVKAAADLQKAADAKFKKDCPTEEALAAAKKKRDDARQAMIDSDGGSTEYEAYKTALADYNALVKDKEQAIADYKDACEKVKTKLEEAKLEPRKEETGKDTRKRPDAPGKPEGKPDATPAKAPEGKPPVVAPSGQPGPTLGTPPLTTPSDALKTSPTSEALAKALGQQQQQPAQAQAPAAVAQNPGQQPQQNRKQGEDKSGDGVFTNGTLNALLGTGALSNLANVATPKITPVAVPPAATAPVTAPSAPATLPPSPAATVGQSFTGAQTHADVTGRADGPRTFLSGAPAENATTAARPTAPTTATHPVGGAPMYPPMAGMGNHSPGGVRAKEDLPTRYQHPDSAELQGDHTIGAAVRGGTIAQRRDALGE